MHVYILDPNAIDLHCLVFTLYERTNTLVLYDYSG